MTEPTSQVGTELLFENSLVRVWSMELGPGDASPLHRHHLDYVIVYVTASRIALVRDGVASQSQEFRDGYVQYIRVQEGIVHQIVNTARALHRQIIVEFKESGDLAQTSDNGRKGSATL